MKKFFFAVAVALLLFAGSANAQLIANGSVGVSVTVAANSFVSTTGGGSLTIDPVTGQSNVITLTVGWNLPTTWSNVRLYSYFQSATAALSTTGGTNIPSSAISATVGMTNANGPISGNPCTYSTGYGTAGANCQPQTIGSTTDGISPSDTGGVAPITVTYQLVILNYANNGQHLAAGAYTGTLSIIAVAV